MLLLYLVMAGKAVNSQNLTQLVDFLKKARSLKSSDLPAITSHDKFNFELLGYKTPEVESETVYEGVSFTKSLTELEQLISTTSDEVPIEIEFEFERAIQGFSDWL